MARGMTIIEIRPFRNGWKVFEAPGVGMLNDFGNCRRKVALGSMGPSDLFKLSQIAQAYRLVYK